MYVCTLSLALFIAASNWHSKETDGGCVFPSKKFGPYHVCISLSLRRTWRQKSCTSTLRQLHLRRIALWGTKRTNSHVNSVIHSLSISLLTHCIQVRKGIEIGIPIRYILSLLSSLPRHLHTKLFLHQIQRRILKISPSIASPSDIPSQQKHHC